MNNNILVIGTSGCGKTISIMELRILETFDKSLIITTVTKRRVVKKYFLVMKKREYEVWDLNFVHPSEGNCGYDSLMHISSYNDITFLARSILLVNPQKEQTNADSYWDDGANSLFCSRNMLYGFGDRKEHFNKGKHAVGEYLYMPIGPEIIFPAWHKTNLYKEI